MAFNEGHALVVPRKVVGSIYELDREEWAAVFDLVEKTRDLLMERYHPDGFNIGVNDGPAAGQTVSHAHVHVIPRYKGDVPDPRGGDVLWIAGSDRFMHRLHHDRHRHRSCADRYPLHHHQRASAGLSDPDQGGDQRRRRYGSAR